MDVIAIFAIIAGVVFLGFISELIFKKTKIPDVILLIGVGIIIGSILKWANADTFGEGSSLFTTFALVFILFQGALNIDFKTLFKSLSDTLIVTVLNFILSVLVSSGIVYVLYQDVLISILIGMIIAGTSSAVVIPLVNNIEISEKNKLILTLESAISDVLCIIGALTVLQIMETGDIVASQVFKNILSSFSLALVVGMIFGIVWIVLMHKFDVLSRAYMVTVAVVIGLYAFVESSFVGASGAIAALAFGLLLGNSRTILIMINGSNMEKNPDKENADDPNERVIKTVLSSDAKNFYSEISFFVKTFFFVYLGILIDFSDPMVFLYGAILTLGIYLVRPLAVAIVFNKKGLETRDRTFLEILIPKGLAAAVLAQLSIQTGLIVGQAASFVNMILSVVLISILMTSILLFLTEKGIFKGFYFFIHKEREIEESAKK